jgi:hypothetical protein
MPPTPHCTVGPRTPGYLTILGPPCPDGSRPTVALIPTTNPNAGADAALFAGAAGLLRALSRVLTVADGFIGSQGPPGVEWAVVYGESTADLEAALAVAVPAAGEVAGG